MYEHEAKINAKNKFTYEITMTKQRKLNIKPGTYVTNCNFTCHYPCDIIKKNSTVMQWKATMIKIQNVEHVQGTVIDHM